MALRGYQEELRHLLFYQTREPTRSTVWTSGIPARLNVYRNNTRTNWAEALDHDFSLTRKQFSESEWEALRRRYFIKHPPSHWELNTALRTFPKFLARQRVRPYVLELADFEWQDLQIFIDRSVVRKNTGMTNPTVRVRAYRHQIFYWVDAKAPLQKPPLPKPEVLLFYRDSKNTSHIREADPLMLLMLDHFGRAGAKLKTLEPLRRKLLPQNKIPLSLVYKKLAESDLL